MLPGRHQNDRMYLPQDDLALFNYRQQDISNKVNNESFQNLIMFEYDRALSYYQKSQDLFRKIRDNRLRVAQMMGSIYYRLLEEIRLKNFNLFQEQITLSKRKKMSAIFLQFMNRPFL